MPAKRTPPNNTASFHTPAAQYNGFGGKIEAGETVQAAAEREMLEESGVTVLDATQVGA